MNRTNEPASLLLALAPDKKILSAGMTQNPERDFPRFIDTHMRQLGNDPLTVPRNWFLRLDYKRCSDMPIFSTPDIEAPDLLGQIQQSLTRGQATVRKVLPLFDVYFCRQRGRDPLAPENRHDILVQDILYGTDLYHLGSKDNTKINLLQGIRTDRGLHLFAADDAGNAALQCCLLYYGFHFFDKQRGTDRLDKVSVFALEDAPETLCKECEEMFKYKPLDLPQRFFCRNTALIELTEHRFDMLPTFSNMDALFHEIETECNVRNYNFRCLAMLHEGNCTLDKLPYHSFADFEYGDHFRDLLRAREEDVNGNNDQRIAALIRERAGQILETQFPDLRYCREPEQIEAHLRKQNPDQAFYPEQQRRGPKL